MSGHNHIPLEKSAAIQIALIEGTKITAFCMIKFVPALRVGSGGKIDEPAWPMCPRCQRVKDVLIARRKLRDEVNRLNRELRPIQKELDELWAGKPMRVAEPSTQLIG